MLVTRWIVIYVFHPAVLSVCIIDAKSKIWSVRAHIALHQLYETPDLIFGKGYCCASRTIALCTAITFSGGEMPACSLNSSQPICSAGLVSGRKRSADASEAPTAPVA